MTTIAASRFADRLKEYRQRAKLSQQELSDVLRNQYGITLYGSDISKLEQDRRKPPKIDAALAIIRTLHLSEEEAQRFLEAGSYPPSVVNLLSEQPKQEAWQDQEESLSTGQLYPPTTPEQAAYYLRSPYPSWQLSEDGCIVESNRTAMWLFMATVEADLLDVSVFEVFTRPWNLARILMTGKRNDFWLIKLQVLRWMEKRHPSEGLSRAKRIILENPTLSILYENLDKLNLDTISFYEYTLFIQHPEKQNRLLRFRVKIWITKTQECRVDRFVVVYEPNDAYTSDIITRKHQELSAVQNNHTNGHSHPV